ncbi:hypothetical protein [Spongorhabdus nitratireducens]
MKAFRSPVYLFSLGMTIANILFLFLVLRGYEYEILQFIVLVLVNLTMTLPFSGVAYYFGIKKAGSHPSVATAVMNGFLALSTTHLLDKYLTFSETSPFMIIPVIAVLSFVIGLRVSGRKNTNSAIQPSSQAH